MTKKVPLEHTRILGRANIEPINTSEYSRLIEGGIGDTSIPQCTLEYFGEPSVRQ